MDGLRFACAGTLLALTVTLVAGGAEAAALKKCDDSGRDEFQRAECISPTFPTHERSFCAKGACYRSGVHRHKKTKK
jgi:hypothetical protein